MKIIPAGNRQASRRSKKKPRKLRGFLQRVTFR